MGALINDILQAVEVLPGHRQKNTRSKSLHLDDLLDASSTQFSGGARDFLFMAYRYSEAQENFARVFFKKEPKSLILKDYCLIAYSSLLSRDQIPSEVIAHEIVEASKKELAEPLVRVLNAYCRSLVREKNQQLKKLAENPALLLNPALRKRWAKNPSIIDHLGKTLLQRPSPGIWAFDSSLNYQKLESQVFLKSESPLQAMNSGSANLMQHYFENFPLQNKSQIKILDFCAAPGAKLLWSIFQAQKSVGSVSAVAVEQKHSRMQRLKENIKRFGIQESIETLLLSVGEETLPASIVDQEWDLLLIDLPCSGSGTLASRPDLLGEDLGSRIEGLKSIQNKILAELPKLKFKSALISVCSIDPEECQSISTQLKKEADYQPWQRSNDPMDDGLTAWFL